MESAGLTFLGERFASLMLPVQASRPVERPDNPSWWDEGHLQSREACVVYGGLGRGYLAAKKWLRESLQRRLVFLESDGGVVRHFLGTRLAEELLLDPQVELWLAPEGDWERNTEALARLVLLRPLFV